MVIDVIRERGILNEESMSLLRGKTLALDASLLLRKVQQSQTKKTLQEGHLALDTRSRTSMSLRITPFCLTVP
jgi:hypothetical protein